MWKAVRNVAIATFGGSVAIGTGAIASISGIGSIGGVPEIMGGSAAIGWGISQVIAGFFDNEIPFMGIKEAVIQGVTEPGLFQDELLGLNTLTDSFITGRTATNKISNINSFIQSGNSIYNSGLVIKKALKGKQNESSCE